MSEGAAPDVISAYQRSLAERGFVSDPAQWRAVECLQRLFEEWTEYKARRSSALWRLLVKPPLPKGVYLWGGVGRGKSFLMDAFYLCVPLVRKRRVHLHHFMREIHRELDELKGTEDPIAEVAARTARRYRLVCFDEFHVADIADAMILGRYLAQVMERGVEFVMTSNYHPDRLYDAGLQRERFLPAIELLKGRLDVIEVDNGTDYRRVKMERLKVYHTGPDREAELARIFGEIGDVAEEPHSLDVEGRRIPYRKRASYARFVALMPSALIPLCAYLSSLFGRCTGISFIESTPLTVCHNARIHQHRVFAGLAQRGKSSTGWFFGFKLHVVFNDHGELLDFMLTAGNVHDLKALPRLAKRLFGKLFGDKGYISAAMFGTLFASDHVQLITKLRRNMKNQLMPLADKLLLRKRAIGETIIDQLKNISQVEHCDGYLESSEPGKRSSCAPIVVM